MTFLMELTASPENHWSKSCGAPAGLSNPWASCPPARSAPLLPKGHLTEEEDHGYQSSESPQALDMRNHSETHRNNTCKIGHDTSNHTLDESHVRGDTGEVVRAAGDHYGSRGTPEAPDRDATLANPLLTHSIHDNLWCCTNGYFCLTSVGPFSEFQSNCGCTTHNLVDWSTRVSWTNLHLRHQYKVREVTYVSPYRATGFQKVVPHAHRSGPEYGARPAIRPSAATLPTPPRSRTPQAAEKMKSVDIVKQEMPAAPHNLNGERPFVCEESGCGRAFCRNEELTRHSRIHSGNRPFLCQRCGRRFVRRDHLTKHQRTHLPVQAKRSYTCPLPACKHRYTRSDALTRHMWTAHHTRVRQPSRPHARIMPTTPSPTFPSPRLPSATCLSATLVPHTPGTTSIPSRTCKLLLPPPIKKEP
ncbi:uncharacterized protein [Panulirus ornatus]|uniref:uncharacterized protein n=1 Tax=Panulirus ornatus TaxID=150431 RepID=UPI003A86B99B